MNYINVLLITLLICLIAGVFPLNAQNKNPGVINGTVFDTNGNTLGSVNIGLFGTDMGTATAIDGKYHISGVPAGEYELLASFVGFDIARKPVTILSGDTVTIDLTLQKGHYDMPQVNIFAARMEGHFETIPGALTYIDNREIERLNPVNTNEVLRRSPGVHVVEEEGVGMRMNLAIRGLDAARSRSTLILEDGIPLALAPYGEPEMYYSPLMEKMEGVEILKGSGSILYGPQTIGGIVNFITKDPPAERTRKLNIKGGQGGYFSGVLSYGNAFGRAGVQTNFIHKQADEIGTTRFRINDLSTKLKLQLHDRSYLGIKVGIYDETSNATYVGMTQPMFDSGEYDFPVISPHDRLNLRRYNLSATHDFYFNSNTELTTTVFGYSTTRNWKRQDFTYNSFDDFGNPNPGPANHTGITWGDESVEEGAIYMLNGTGNRNRTYEITGAESRLTTRYTIGSMSGHEFSGGLRFLHERAFEQRINGNKPDTPAGNLVNDEVRTGFGKSAYAHNRFAITSRFSISGGVRVEMFDDTRDIRRSTYVINNERQVRDTSIVATNSLVEFIPGTGFNLTVSDNIGIFGGIHRGFAPPRTKDAISDAGEVYELDAEKSWNYELGIRAHINEAVRYEVTAFYLDFSNQVIPIAEHAGGVGAGATNAGATFHRGVEAGLILDIGSLLNWEALDLAWDANIGYVQARFNSKRFMDDGNGGTVNVQGNRTPYAPEWLVSSALTAALQNGLSARITGTYVSDQFTDPVNRTVPLNNGRDGLIPAYKLVDLSLRYHITGIHTTVSAGVKNLLNERYIASRRPQGIMPGTPRFIMAGFQIEF